jgi:hypothetical protein
MKAIFTKYHGPGNVRGSRISASDEDGNRVVIPYRHDLNSEEAHLAAAQALCDKMHWTGTLIGGSHKKGYVFVFGQHFGQCLRASNRLADLACAVYCPHDSSARKIFPTATWAEIIAQELGIVVPE